MSALLVQTSNHMITVSKMMKEQGLEDTYVLIGGAPVSDRHAAYVALAGDEDVAHMRKNVFYCPTAMDGVNVMNELKSVGDTGPILNRNVERLRSRYERAVRRAREDEDLRKTLPRRVVSFEKHALVDKPWFAPELVSVPLVKFRPHIDKRNLFSLNWKFGAASKQAKQGTAHEELERLFLEWTARADAQGWLEPQGVMGCFPCYSEGDDVVVLDQGDRKTEIARFTFDVVIGANRDDVICGAQYFRPKAAGALDAVGLQISSAGPRVDEQLEKFKAEGDSEAALFLQGLSDRIAEDMAEYVHQRLRERLGLGGTNRGTRWSPGYPAITKIAQNIDIHRLLEAQKRIGAVVTETGEFFPTGCTAAVVSFHPDARYM
jgi:5-methyltetrahydrofolate--homocysteine methyltransferase